MRDGTVATHPNTGDPKILHVEGPSDPELGVVAIQSEGSEWIALLLNHSCHPVHGYPGRFVTAGWPGAWANRVREYLLGFAPGSKAVPIVFNGFAGNIHHFNHLDPTHNDDYQHLGRILMEKTHHVLSRITEFSNTLPIGWISKTIEIPMRKMPDQDLADAREYLRKNPNPVWVEERFPRIGDPWVYSLSRISLHEQYERRSAVDAEVQVFRIGDLGLVAFPGEPFVEAQLQIKLESPFYPTYGIGGCNAYTGYIPTRKAFSAGGYETKVGNWSKLAPEALDTLTGAAIDSLRQLKDKV
jgi:hypothetical protein